MVVESFYTYIVRASGWIFHRQSQMARYSLPRCLAWPVTDNEAREIC